MKQNLLGIFLFTAIVGGTIFINEYSVPLPTDLTLEKTEEESKAVKDEYSYPINSNLRIGYVVYYKKLNKFQASCRKWEAGNYKYFLHFFRIENGKTKFLLTQDFRPTLASTSGTFWTNLVEIDSLSKLKSLKNIYVIAQSDRDYREEFIPTFVPELAVPLTVDRKN